MVFSEQTHAIADGRLLVLRPPVAGDAQMCIGFLKAVGGETDFLLCDGEGIPGLSLSGEESYLAASRVDPDVAMYLGFVEEELVTVFDVRPGNRPRIRHNGLVSLAVRKPYWGLGIGSLAMGTMIAAARASGTLKRLYLDVHAENERAIRLYQRFGFTQAGRYRNHLCVRGTYADQLLMDMEL